MWFRYRQRSKKYIKRFHMINMKLFDCKTPNLRNTNKISITYFKKSDAYRYVPTCVYTFITYENYLILCRRYYNIEYLYKYKEKKMFIIIIIHNSGKLLIHIFKSLPLVPFWFRDTFIFL